MPRLLIPFLLLLIPTQVFAEARIPAFILQVPPSVSDIFIADTSAAALLRFAHEQDAIRLADSSYMSIGQKGAGKERAWDRRSPLGIYFVVDRLDTARLHEKYGVMAFPLDYPNVRDRQLERTGDGIWVHGVQPGNSRRPALDTDGCLALPNDKLTALENNFVPLRTPVIIAREMRWQDKQTRDRLRDELRAAVNEWFEAYALADEQRYFSLYADDFSYRGLTASEWRAYRRYGMRQRGKLDAAIDELLLLADPEEEGLFLSRFHQVVTDGDDVRTTTRRLYWRRNEAGQLEIIAEDNG